MVLGFDLGGEYIETLFGIRKVTGVAFSLKNQFLKS